MRLPDSEEKNTNTRVLYHRNLSDLGVGWKMPISFVAFMGFPHISGDFPKQGDPNIGPKIL